MKVFIADDQKEVRSALRLILEHNGVEVIGEANHYQQLLGALDVCRPDVLLFDWELPGNPYRSLSPSDPLPELLACCTGMQVIVMSCLPESRLETAPLACGFISKSDPPDIFLRAVTDLVDRTAV
jgi:DNA-binding NarL/FixJ family response regulator